MGKKTILGQDLRQRHQLAQTQIQLAKLLELTAPELDERVSRELEENQALEVDDESDGEAPTVDGTRFTESEEEMRKKDYADPDDIPSYRLNVRNTSADDYREYSTPADTSESMYDILYRAIAQRRMPEDVALAARYIIGNLDSDGYLRRSATGIADDIIIDLGINIDPEVVKEALRQVQSLEPYGIAARDLQECLLIQLRHRPESGTRDDAINILENAFEAFSMKHSHRITSALKIPPARVTEAVELIRSLNPRPGASLGNGPGMRAAPIIPDFVVEIDDEGDITVSLNNRIPELRISESFANAVRRMKDNAETRRKNKGQQSAFFTTRYNDARNFIQLLKQRQETLMSVMTAIVKRQRGYFLTEDVHQLVPMGIKDIAEDTGYDISVISRATSGKYVATPWGVYPLRFFFSDSLGEEGEEFTAKAVEDIIRRLVDEEDKRHPLSDQSLMERIAEEGYKISRRTVAKYRDRMNIPESRLRKEM